MSDTLPGIAPAPVLAADAARLRDVARKGRQCAAEMTDLPEAAALMREVAEGADKIAEAIEAEASSASSASSPRCTCGTVIPCDAHETDDDRREAMRKIREEMTERVRAFAEGKVIP